MRSGLFAATAIAALMFAPATFGVSAPRHHHPIKPAAPDLSIAAPESVGFSSERLQRLTDAMHGAVDQNQVAGIVTMLARHGKIVSVDAYGKRNIAAGAPMTRDTIFRIYSQSKPLTGLAMMILFEEGRWSLDDPISKYIPEFANLKVFTGLDKDGKPLTEDPAHPPTMRELVTHTAGFGYGLGADNYVDQQFQAQHVLRSNGLKEMVDKIATIPLKFQPGTKWAYSASVDIQGYVVEKLTGQSLADFMQQNVFKPLGMKDTDFVVPADKVSRFSSVYALSPKTSSLVEVTPAMSPLVQDFTKVPPMDSGGGGLVSTADDYAHFCQMMLDGGVYRGARVLSPAAVRLMRSDILENTVVPVRGEPDGSFGGDALGFGVDFGVFKNAAKAGSLSQDGAIWWGGAAGTWFWIDPKNDLFFLGMIQRYNVGNMGDERLSALAQTLVYAALVNPER